VYPLKTKGEVAAAVLKEWMPRAPRESGHNVKVIRTDNGGEFIGANFEAVLKKKGIQHQLTVPYNPQQNGVAERFNRTLQEGAHTLLGRAGLPDPFWVTALRQVALVKNRVLATVGDKQWVPYTKCQQLTVSRDVKFLESLYYKEWKQQQQKLPTTPLIIEADEVQRPSRQVQVTVSGEEIFGVTEDGGEPEVEDQQQQQQQQQDAPQGAARPADRPRRDVRPPNRLTYPSFGKPKVVQAGSVAEQCDEEEIAHCYWAAVSVTRYTDASFNSVKADGASIGGYVCLFGGGAVSWRSEKQNEVGLSSCETEYMALHHGVKEVVWLRRLLEEIGVSQREPTVMFCDNVLAVKLAKNACLHGLTKHIRPKWHWVRGLLDKEERLEIVKTQQQAADILTKRLAENEHWKGMKLAGMSVH
ncbi:unnamed protein product, partial [Closterium sp. NIES-53]